MSRRQKTIRNEVEVEGVGLFSGTHTRLRLKPAAVDTGVTFIRTDLPEQPAVPANLDSLKQQPHRTSLTNGAARVEMAEHLLAALLGLQVDNVVAELEGPDLPNIDGSSQCYLEALAKAGLVEQDKTRITLSLSQPISVSQGAAALVALPNSDGLVITYTLDYGDPTIPAQTYSLKITPESFAREIAPARTFVPEFQVEEYKRLGLGKGASYDNVLVVGEDGVINNELRFPDEFARHKVLDLMGDLYLLNADLQAHIVAVRSGHALNAQLLRKLVREKDKQMHQDSTLKLEKLLEILPHRYPFLLLDRVIEMEEGKRAVGIKNVTFNEAFFQGHFPTRPIMPGVLQVEAMAQLAGVLLMSYQQDRNKLPMLMCIDKAKLRRPVVPGDQLVLEATVLNANRRGGHVRTRATVNEKLVAEAEMKFVLVDNDREKLP